MAVRVWCWSGVAEVVLKYTQPTKGHQPDANLLPIAVVAANTVAHLWSFVRFDVSVYLLACSPCACLSDFLCPLSANTYGIDFLSFKIRDMDSQHVVFEVAKDPNAAPVAYPDGFDYNQLRSINYKFPAQFLRYETVGTTSANTHAHIAIPAMQANTHTSLQTATCCSECSWL